ncbi:MAG: hypothetical protein OXH13_11945 [Chloroflexi bacterium]|nr:hypothetical protein [Chloroflexota bacterium]MCY3695647.1 hypothetical protein [Chloroflexota bacterium]
MTQLKTHPSAALPRPQGRGTRVSVATYLERLDAPIDWRRAVALHRRLLAGDLSVLRDAARTESDNGPAAMVLVLGVLAASLGAWLWLVIESRGAVVGDSALRVMLLGSLASLVAWGLWTVLTWRALGVVFQVKVELRALARSMAVAGGFFVWQFFMIAGPAGFAVGLVTTLAALLLAILAVRAAAPDADDRAAVISVGMGFAIYALALSMLADLAGVGSGIFVHALG